MDLPERRVALIVGDERTDPHLGIELDARTAPQTLENRCLTQDRTRTQELGNVDHASIVGGAPDVQKGSGTIWTFDRRASSSANVQIVPDPFRTSVL